MWDIIRFRHRFVSVVFLLYLLPLLLICSFATLFSSWLPLWSTFSVGLLLSVMGALIFFLIFLDLEEKEPLEAIESVSSSSEEVKQLQSKVIELEKSLQFSQISLQEEQSRNEELLKSQEDIRENAHHTFLEKEKYIEKFKELDKEFSLYKTSSEEAIDGERNQLQTAKRTIVELREMVDIKQKQNEKLEQKIRDLTYEIKTLLQLADMESSSSEDNQNLEMSGSVRVEENYDDQSLFDDESLEKESSQQLQDPDEAKVQLKRCIDIAQKITSSHYFTAHKSRFRDFALDNYALDLRRLCDSLCSENNYTVFVYSPKERKLLFVNNKIRDLLGWTPDKFVQDFDHIVQEGMFEWSNSVSQLNTLNQLQTRFVMKARSGKDLLIYCQLGLIPTGVFKSNVIGVLSPA